MALKFRITAGTGAQNPNAANIVVRAGVCSSGVPCSPSPPGVPYQYSSGQDCTPDLGYGPLCDTGLHGTTFGGSTWYAVKIPATTAGTISAVTKPGGSTSPTPTIAGSNFDSVTNSPYNAFNLALRYSTGGLPGAAVVDVALDGFTYAYTYPMPPQLPATLRGTVDVTGITWSTLNNLTLRWKPDGGSVVTVTMGGTVAGEADVLTAFAAQPTVAAVFVQIGDKRYLQVTGVTLGTTGVLDFMGGSAEDLLGFTPSVAVQRGTVDVTGLTWANLDSETLIFTPDGGSLVTATMGGSITAEADVLTAFSGHPTLVAYFVHVGAHHYLEVAALTPGITGALLSGAGTANTNLGFTGSVTTNGNAAGVAAGLASVLSIPTLGIAITFPGTSAYTAKEIQTATGTAPRHSQADMDAALAAYIASGLQAGLLEIVQQPRDATDLAAYVADLDTTIAGWEAQTSKAFVHYLLPAPMTLADASVRTALMSQSSRYGTVAAGDLYYTGISPGPKGSFRRSPCQALAARCANFSLSEDPGNGTFGALPGTSMTAPDGVTKARDENTASVKLGTSRGPGFTVIGSIKQLPYFVRGVTRAGTGNLFVDLGVTRMVAYSSSIIFAQLQGMQNPTFDLNPNGTITHADAAQLVRAFEKALTVALIQGKHASKVIVSIDETEIISTTRNLTVTYTVQERGQGEDITVTLDLVGTIVTAGQLAAA